MLRKGIKTIEEVTGSGEPVTLNEVINAMLVFSNKDIEIVGEENVELAIDTLIRRFNIVTEDLNDDFMAIKMVDTKNNREIVIGTGTKRYGVIDLNDIYEVYDMIRASGFVPKKLSIWRWRKYRIFFENDKYKDIKIAWDDRYGHHEDTYTVNIFLENTYDRGGSFKIGTYVIREVCSNGLFGRGDVSVSVRHYMKAENQIKKIVDAIPSMIKSSLNTLVKYAQVWVDDKFMEIIKKHVGKKVVEEAIKNMGRHDNPMMYEDEHGKINYYDFIQGLTYEYTHNRDVSDNTLMQLNNKIHKSYEEYIRGVMVHA